jgi:imidazolonepropionase-like amidohydrolase
MTPAKIWGIADQYGSIEPGKMADLIVTDGDPLEPRSSVKMMFIHGKLVELESKHTKLYKKYMDRP